jgi:hypothetical protein
VAGERADVPENPVITVADLLHGIRPNMPPLMLPYIQAAKVVLASLQMTFDDTAGTGKSLTHKVRNSRASAGRPAGAGSAPLRPRGTRLTLSSCFHETMGMSRSNRR